MSVKNPFKHKNKQIIIQFDEIFNNPDYSDFNTFVLLIGKKRVYGTFAPTICKDNNKILSMNNDIANQVIFAYFNIKKAIDNKMFVKIDTDKDLKKYGATAKRDFGRYENFINFMISNLFTVEFVELAKKYVDKNYKLEVDEKESMKYAPGTTFTNEHFKMFYTVSTLTKFAIPLCTHYIYVNSDLNINVYEFMFTVFDAIFEIVTDGKVKLLRKLYQYVDRIICSTKPNNKAIWDMFPAYGDTSESITDDIIVKIVTTIIPRFDFNQQIISYITAVSRDSIKRHKIWAKFPYDSFRIYDNTSSLDDEDKLSENDVFDMFYRNTNEMLVVLNRFGNDDTIDVICRRLNTTIDPKEFEYYKNNYELHNLTISIVSMIFARYFSGMDNVRSCTFDQFIKLVIIAKHKMRDYGIEVLPNYLIGRRKAFSFSKVPSVSLLKMLRNSIEYNELIERKYSNIRSIFDTKVGKRDNTNPIRKMIESIVHNEYEYNEYLGKQNGTPINFTGEEIVNDVLQLYKRMVI